MIKKIPIQNVIFKNTDEVGLDELSFDRINCDVDDLGNIISTPGLDPFVTLAGGGGDIQSQYYWRDKDVVIAVSGGRIYKINRSGDVKDITGERAELLPHNKVSFASDKDFLFMANGGKIIFYSELFGKMNSGIDDPEVANIDIDGTLGGIYIDEILGDHTINYTSDDAPTQVSHLAYINKVLVCNSLETDLAYYSDPNVPTSISKARFFSAESKTDNIIALLEMRNELVLIGTNSIEFWESTGSQPEFVRIGGQDIARGTMSPDSIQIINNTIYMIDNERRLIRLVRNIQDRDISLEALAMNKELDSFTDITKIRADHVLAGGKTYYVLTSPVDEKTYVFDYTKNQWVSQWAYWDEGVGQWKRWRGNCSIFISQWNAHLVGDNANGKIYKMTTKVNTEDGRLVRRIPVRTGHISQGVFNWKQSNVLRIKLRMDADRITAKNSKISLRWRDDNGEWENERVIDLGNVGQHQFIKEEYALGMYHTRQYEIEYYGDGNLMICGIDEDFEVLEN
jgi:hypothetical protein